MQNILTSHLITARSYLATVVLLTEDGDATMDEAATAELERVREYLDRIDAARAPAKREAV